MQGVKKKKKKKKKKEIIEWEAGRISQESTQLSFGRVQILSKVQHSTKSENECERRRQTSGHILTVLLYWRSSLIPRRLVDPWATFFPCVYSFTNDMLSMTVYVLRQSWRCVRVCVCLNHVLFVLLCVICAGLYVTVLTQMCWFNHLHITTFRLSVGI